MHAGRPKPRTRVSIVEDELLLRRMLEQVLHGRPDVVVAHSAGGCQEAERAIVPRSTDVLLTDVHLEDGSGIELAERLQERDPRLGIVLISSQDSLGSFLHAQSAAPRPWSFLSKRSSFGVNTLVHSVQAAVDGTQVIDPHLVQQSRPRADTPVALLTPAQLRVLTLVAAGMSNEAIARATSTTLRSVENHLLAVYQRLKLPSERHNRRVLATLAFLQQTSRHPRSLRGG